MRIGVDIMGGDFVPAAPVEGAILARQELGSEVELVLIGDQTLIQQELKKHQADPADFEIVHTDEFISSKDSPARAIASKPKSSIMVGLGLMKKNHIQGFVSAGNTGAMLIGSVMGLGKIEGVNRPTIGVLFANFKGKPTLFCDVGANADCKPEALLDFGILGRVYMESVWKVENPKVALLNIGEEANKGPQAVRAAYQLMQESSDINFVGNVEGWGIYSGQADVIVTDGYTGNIVLKFAESLYEIFKKRLDGDESIETFNFERYGGVPILGIEGISIIGHGISTASAIAQMVKSAAEAAQNDLVKKIRAAF